MPESKQTQTEQPPALVDEKGPWPFVTRRVFRSADGSEQVWSSRHHRKGLLLPAAREAEEVAVKLSSTLWMPQQLNWWIGTVFALGALLFALASVLSLWRNLAAAWSLDSTEINAIFFAGSILFLASGYLAFIETCHAHGAWMPSNISWWVVFINLLGCVAFMISALFAFVAPGLPNTAAVTVSVAFTLLGAVGFFFGSLLMLPETVAATAS